MSIAGSVPCDMCGAPRRVRAGTLHALGGTSAHVLMRIAPCPECGFGDQPDETVESP